MDTLCVPMHMRVSVSLLQRRVSGIQDRERDRVKGIKRHRKRRMQPTVVVAATCESHTLNYQSNNSSRNYYHYTIATHLQFTQTTTLRDNDNPIKSEAAGAAVDGQTDEQTDNKHSLFANFHLPSPHFNSIILTLCLFFNQVHLPAP